MQLSRPSCAPLEGRARTTSLEKSLNQTTKNVEHTVMIFGGAPPLEFAVRAGEVVHHLRSSLDHLVWQLVEHNPVSKSAGMIRHKDLHEFPIIRNPKRFRSEQARRKIDGISDSARVRIEGLQPFVTHPDAPDDSPLCIVHRLDIRDKHQALNVVVNGVRISRAYVTDGGLAPNRSYVVISRPYARATEAGTVIASTNTGIEDSQVDVLAEFAPEMAFDRVGTRQDEPLIQSLHRLKDAVIETLLLFIGEFPP